MTMALSRPSLCPSSLVTGQPHEHVWWKVKSCQTRHIEHLLSFLGCVILSHPTIISRHYDDNSHFHPSNGSCLLASFRHFFFGRRRWTRRSCSPSSRGLAKDPSARCSRGETTVTTDPPAARTEPHSPSAQNRATMFV